MSPDAISLLQKLKASGGYPLSSAPLSVVSEMIDAGLIEQRTPKSGKDRTPKLYLTQLGAAEKKRLGAAKTAKPRATKPSALTTIDLQEWGNALEHRLITSITALFAGGLLRPDTSLGSEPDDAILAAQLTATQAVLAPAWRKLVPLPVLRKQFPGICATTLDRMVLELERKGAFDLKIANDPSTVAEPELGIRIPERGLVYFVVAR